MRSCTAAITSKRPQCGPPHGPRYQWGRNVPTHRRYEFIRLTHRVHWFNGAPVRSHDVKEAPLRSRTGAMSSRRPQCDAVEGPSGQRVSSALTHRGHEFKEVLV